MSLEKEAAMSTVETALSKEDLATLEGMLNTTFRLVRMRDWAGWAAMFAEDGVFHPPNQPAVRGRAALQKWGEGFPEVDAIESSDVQIFGEGNLAYFTSRYALRIKGLPPDTGKQLGVFRRGTSGWQVVAGSFNSDLPLSNQKP
jgi:ketosteroid isomerase-like protein